MMMMIKLLQRQDSSAVDKKTLAALPWLLLVLQLQAVLVVQDEQAVENVENAMALLLLLPLVMDCIAAEKVAEIVDQRKVNAPQQERPHG